MCILFFSFWLCFAAWDLPSLTRTEPMSPAVGRRGVNHCGFHNQGIHVYPHMKEAEGSVALRRKPCGSKLKTDLKALVFKHWMQLQAKECQELPEARKGKGKILPGSLEGAQLYLGLSQKTMSDVWSQNSGRIIFCCFESPQLSSVKLLSYIKLFVTPDALSRPPCVLTPGVCQLMLISRWCHPAISPSSVSVSSYRKSTPSIRVFPNESTLCIR